MIMWSGISFSVLRSNAKCYADNCLLICWQHISLMTCVNTFRVSRIPLFQVIKQYLIELVSDAHMCYTLDWIELLWRWPRGGGGGHPAPAGNCGRATRCFTTTGKWLINLIVYHRSNRVCLECMFVFNLTIPNILIDGQFVFCIFRV